MIEIDPHASYMLQSPTGKSCKDDLLAAQRLIGDTKHSANPAEHKASQIWNCQELPVPCTETDELEIRWTSQSSQSPHVPHWTLGGQHVRMRHCAITPTMWHADTRGDRTKKNL